jgi:hypothetical protein
LLEAERVESIEGLIVERGAMDSPHVLSLCLVAYPSIRSST